MKKNILLVALISIALPAFGVCPLTGFCAPPSSSLSGPTLNEKHIPNNLNQIQKPDAFLPKYKEPYHDMLINTEQTQPNSTPGLNNNESSYNSNCQFGLCMPSSGSMEKPSY